MGRKKASDGPDISQSAEDRLANIESLAEAVQKQQRKVDTEEKKVERVRGEFTEAKEKRTAEVNKLKELQDDLTNVAAGGHVERLPFDEKSKGDDKKEPATEAA